MAKYFLNTAQAESCSSGGMQVDMTTTQGTPTTRQSDTTTSEGFVVGLEYFVTVGAAGANGDYNVSVEIDAIDADTEVKWTIRRLNSSCVNQPSGSGESSVYTTPGVKTDTLTLSGHTWASGDVLTLTTTYRRAPGQHGNKDYTLDVNATNSFVNEPSVGGTVVPIMMGQHDQYSGGAGFSP